MRLTLIAILVSTAALAAGCAATSSSTPVAGGQQAAAWTGQVYVSEGRLPESVKYKVMGTVEANARSGYDSGTALYPMLADEARKLGANAVVEVTGARRVTALSWAAAYVKGVAVRVDDADALKKLPGSSH